jgi:hypothetical protein
MILIIAQKIKYHCWIFRILLVVPVIMFSSDVFAQTGTIQGTIRNGSTGGSVEVESLTLIGFETGLDVVEVLSNVSNSFTFHNVSSSQRPYLIQADYQGVLYNANVAVPAGTETVSVEIVVYEQTDIPQELVITNAQYRFSMSETTLQIIKVYNILNESDNPRTYVNNEGTFFFRVSQESHGINTLAVNTGLVPINQEPVSTDRPDVFAVNYPIKPGNTQVTVSYHVEYGQKIHFYSEEILYDIDDFVVVTTPSSMIFTGDRFTPAGTDAHQDFSIYSSEHISAGELLTFTLSGGVPSPLASVPAGQRAVQTPKMGLPGILIAVILLMFILGAGSVLSRNKTPVIEKKKKTLLRTIANRKNVLINDIASLDDTFADHRIQESDYHKKRTQLKNKLMDLYKKFEHTE